MTLKDLTTEDIEAAARRALETLEGTNLYAPGPWPITVRPFAEPPTVIYQAADGKTYERTLSLEIEGEALNCVPGERREVESRTVWVPVDAATAPAFSAGQSFEGHTIKSGLIFRAGSYPDKGVTITNDDIRRIVKSFPPEGVPLMSEHEESLIGKAMEEDGARVLRVWSEKNDTELHGDVRYPNWLAYGLRKLRNCVSVGLKAAKDGLRELSLVLNPRIVDAALFRREAAYAFSSTPKFNDFAARHPREAALLAVEAAKAHNPVPPRREDRNPMNPIITFLRGLTPEQKAAAGITDDQIDALGVADAKGCPTFSDPEAEARMAALESQIEAQQAAWRAEAAVRFYADQLQARKVVPAQREQTIALYTHAAQADAKSGATFGQDGPAVAALKKYFDDSPALFHGQQAIPNANSRPTDGNGGGRFAMTPERARKVLGIPEGK